MTQPIIALQNISHTFKTRQGVLPVLQEVAFSVLPGEIVCLVGESGCGKTTTGKIIAGMLSPGAGEVLFEGQAVSALKGDAYTRYRRAVQVIHQDPYASLNPAHTVGSILRFPLQRHRIVSGEAALQKRIRQLLDMVDLTPADDFVDKFPHQLSGGQRQRVSIARTLTVSPRVIVADEAVSMVDVSIRISLLKTLGRLQRELGIAFVFITHDLALARYFAWQGRVAVMYLGRIVELGPTPHIIQNPQHPYTRALLSAVPEPDPYLTRSKSRIELRGHDIPSLLNLPDGCAFHPRCPWFEAGRCETAVPLLRVVGETPVYAACHPLAEGRALVSYHGSDT